MTVELSIGVLDHVLSIFSKLRSSSRKGDQRMEGLAAGMNSADLVRKHLRALRPEDVEIIPISFEACLTDRVPKMSVTLRVVNHLRKPLDLHTLRTTLFFASLPGFEQLDLVMEVRVPARNTREVCCRRDLTESQLQLLRASVGTGPHMGSVQFSAHGRAGRKPVDLPTQQGVSVTGWILGLESRASLKAL